MKKQIEIDVPEGKELDLEKSNLVFKTKYPASVDEIKGRIYFINDFGTILLKDEVDPDNLNDLSTEERADGFLAMMQLVELCDAWNKIDGFVVDWSDSSQIRYCITFPMLLPFKTCERLNEFVNTFKDLINKASKII